MSSVPEIEAAILRLSRDEMQQVRDWIDHVIEDGLTFTAEFESKIVRSEAEMAKGLEPRTRREPSA